MDEATRTITPQHSRVIAALARQAAVKEVKRQLQARGRKVAHFAHREIVAAAKLELAAHRQAYLEQTVEWVRKSPELQALYDREQRGRATLRTSAQSAKA